MAHYRVPKNTVKDCEFVLLTAEGGNETDNYNFTDGLTSAQWPTVRFYTEAEGGGTEITSSVVKDITSDTIASATHKHPTGSTGIWRDDLGIYNVRVQPQNSLALDVYYMRVSFAPTSGNTRTEDHEFEVIASGDISFGDLVFGSIEWTDITRGLTTSLTQPQVEALIEESIDWAKGKLKNCGVDVEAAPFDEELPESVRIGIINYTRHLISMLDASAGGIPIFRKEGSKQVRYSASSTDLSKGFLGTANDMMRDYCMESGPYHRARLGVVERRIPRAKERGSTTVEFYPDRELV